MPLPCSFVPTACSFLEDAQGVCPVATCLDKSFAFTPSGVKLQQFSANHGNSALSVEPRKF